MKIDRIVLVDDNEADNVFHEVVLRRAGFSGELKVFEMAESALKYLRALPAAHDEHPSLVALDLNMPGMDGWEFAAAAQPLLQRMPWLVLVMLTSSSAVEDRARAEAMPEVHGFLTKPLDLPTARLLLDAQPA